MIENDDAATGVARFQIVHESDGRYHWQLINPHGTPAARSMESYATEDDAVAAAEQARRLISKRPSSAPDPGEHESCTSPAEMDVEDQALGRYTDADIAVAFRADPVSWRLHQRRRTRSHCRAGKVAGSSERKTPAFGLLDDWSPRRYASA